MQIKLFTIPIGDSGLALNEMNAFLRAHKILEVENHIISNEKGAYWTFCVRFIENNLIPVSEIKLKVDYRETLDPALFAKFSTLREIRKRAASEEGVPAFAVFTDEELIGLAKLEDITTSTMLSVKGIGDKKIQRYAKYFIKPNEKNEKGGLFD